MILERIHLIGFRSVQAPLDFWIKPEVTCLVGANEHGKTNLLEAVTYLNTSDFESSDKCRSYTPKSGKIPTLEFFLVLDKSERSKAKQKAQEIINKLSAITEANEKNETLKRSCLRIISEIDNGTKAVLKVRLVEGYKKSYWFNDDILNSTSHADSDLPTFWEEMLPEVKYFEASNELPDSVTLEDLEQRRSYEFEGLLRLAGVWHKRKVLFEDSTEAHKLLTQASRKLKREVGKIWSQAKGTHTFHFRVVNGRLQVSIEDKTGTWDTPANRSLGFKSFFSFYLSLFAQTSMIEPKGYIFVFDEPGIHLHPQGQKDLLREIRKLGKQNQIVYSTHSPFLIDRNDITRTSVVVKGTGPKEERGTRITAKASGSNWAPVRNSLGIVMNDSFFYADVSLLVEGTSDRIYIHSLLNKLRDTLGVDMNFLSIVDTDRRKEMIYFVRLLLAEDRSLVVLNDSDSSGLEIAKAIKKMAKEMHKEDKLKVINIGEFYPKAEAVNKSIEDVLPRSIYVQAVNEYITYLKTGAPITEEELETARGTDTLGAATGKLLHSKGVLSDANDLGKATIATLFNKILDETDLHDMGPLEGVPYQKLCLKLKELLCLS